MPCETNVQFKIMKKVSKTITSNTNVLVVSIKEPRGTENFFLFLMKVHARQNNQGEVLNFK